MAKPMMIEEFHLTIYAPRRRPKAFYAAIRAALNDRGLHAAVRRAVRKVLRAHPSLGQVRIVLTR